MPLTREQIAWRAAQDLQDGWYVNLGIGLPLLVAEYIPPQREVWLHSENGVLGVGPRPAPGQEDPDLVNAGKEFITLRPGGSFCSQAESFALIRGGHLDAALMGAFQVSANGDLANWKLPHRRLGNVGGAMDIAVGARRVFVLMEHCDPKTGQSKLVERCTYPLTTARCVRRIYTNLAVVEVRPHGFHLLEVAPGVSLGEVRDATGAPLTVDPAWREMDLSGFPGVAVSGGGGKP